MKKRIISLLLAVITVLQIIPWAMLPILAESYISLEDMEVGKLYRARFKTLEESGWVDFQPFADATTNVPYTSILKDSVPAEFTVKLMNAGDTRLYVTNDEWKGEPYEGAAPIDLNNYRYVNAEELVILEKIEEATEFEIGVTYNGKPVSELALFEDGKMTIRAQKPAGMNGEVAWGWEILVGDQWVRIGDKNTDTLDVTYALVVNVLDENRETKVRAVADDGKLEHHSAPIAVKVKTAPKPIDTSYENDLRIGTAPLATKLANGGRLMADGDTSTDRVTITVNFIKVRPDGTKVEAAHHDVRTLTTDYGAYEVLLPNVLGYYPSEDEPILLNNGQLNLDKLPEYNASFKQISIDAGLTSDKTITVYYYPTSQDYVVYHYIQNVDNDLYTLYYTEDRSGLVDKAIGDVHKEYTGFHHLFYDHTEVATDGSTVIEVYYDREYFAVLFDLVHSYAYGQDNLYVRYQTEVGISDPKCEGYSFDHWAKKIGDNQYNESLGLIAKRENKVIVDGNLEFKAIWREETTSYSIVYWLENPNDGGYSVWDEKTVSNVTSGGFAIWQESDLTDKIKNSFEYTKHLVSLNTTEILENYDDREQGNIIEGDGSTTVDVYFNRRTYNISFLAKPDASLTHSHDTGSCVYNPMYCTHIHSDTCTESTHKHDASCGATICGYTEHMHSNACCDTHRHTMDCYENVQHLSALGGALKDKIIDEKASENWISVIASWIGIDAKSWVAERLQGSAGAEIQKVTDSEIQKLITMEPPKNLKTGFIYAKSGVSVNFSYKYDAPWYLGGGGTDTYSGEFSYTVVYIDNENGDSTDDWYYYNAPSGTTLQTEDIITAKCDYPDHDHTSGCTYTDETKCDKTEHIHNDNCYTCNKANGTCPHQHTADCYGNVCMVPRYEHYKDDNAGIDGNYTVLRLQAKYGQDITEYLPYYLELSDYGLHKDGGANFVGWKYAGTGWAQTDAKLHYVKHVTMVEELCYSSGVTAKAEYDAGATVPYMLYYLFESFDRSDKNVPYDFSGAGRKPFGGTWYDSDPVHRQLVYWNPNNPLSEMNAQKTIEGMKFAGKDDNPGTVNGTVGETEITATVDAYFYNRETTENLVLHIQGNDTPLLTVPGDVLKYGVSLKDIKDYIKSASAYGNFDVDAVKDMYPDGLEANAYEFAGWYSTPYISENTKVDWETEMMPKLGLHLYALWQPVTRHVQVYEDATLTTRFGEDNHGNQSVGHRSFAIAPDYRKSEKYKGYDFLGWFYVDPKTNEETAFLFNFAITQDIQVYAKWSKDVLVPYEVHFKTEDGRTVAPSIIGTAVAGQNKTFRAATEEDLNVDYRHGFFPQVGSHTIQMNLVYEGDEIVPNTYTFVYDEIESVTYWVKFVDNATGEEFVNPDPMNPIYPKAKELTTQKAAVTELFEPIAGYEVDRYAKSLIVSTADAANNVITFYYDKIEENEPITAPWIVNHMFENSDGSYFMYKQFPFVDEIGAYEFGEILVGIEGYTFANAEAKTREKDGETVKDKIVPLPASGLGFIPADPNADPPTNEQYGYILNEYGMEINLYYTRNKVGYTVVYKAPNPDYDSSKPESETNPKEIVFNKIEDYTVSAKDSEYAHGDKLTVALKQSEHLKIVNQGYQLVDDTQTSITMTLYVDETRNVITFLYQKFDATFEYQIVCDDPSSGVGLSMTRETIAAGSANALLGAIPYESETYYFAGWFTDAACSIPVDPNTHSVTLVSEELFENYSVTRLTPTKTQFEYDDENGDTQTGNLYLSATYYALFLPRSATLDITLSSGQGDSFILTFVGDAGTFAEGTTFTVAVQDGVKTTVTNVPIGTYTFTMDQKWSWRYAELAPTAVAVNVGEGGKVVLSLSPTDQQWLTDDAAGVFTAP